MAPTSRVFIYPPPSPIRRMPRSVQMSLVVPSPYVHRVCKTESLLYADETIWCQKCGRKVKEDECVNIHRGRTSMTRSPEWQRIIVD